MSETTRSTVPEPGPASPAAARHVDLPSLLSGLGLFVLILTLQPFIEAQAAPEGETASGNIVNQIGFLALGSLYLTAMLRFTGRPVLQKLVSPAWILVFMVAGFSCLQALDPQASFRALMLTGIAMIVVAAVLVLPSSEPRFALAAANAALAVILLVYAVLLLAPHLAIHGAEGAEGGHAGDWRGHLSHKNFAAPVFSILAMIGIYAWRSGLKLQGALIALLGMVFVLKSGSKTTMGFLPLAIGIVFLARLTGAPRLTLLMHSALVAAIAALTVGSAFSPTLRGIAASLVGDASFTGRDEIWRFAAAHIAERPWLGFGYVSFWQTPIVTALEENFEASWDVRGIGSAHNSYLDAMLMFGIPGGLLVTLLLVIRPLGHFVAAYRTPASRNLADLFAMILIFMTYVGMLESIVLNRSDPLWVLFAMAVLGLELVSRMRTKPATLA